MTIKRASGGMVALLAVAVYGACANPSSSQGLPAASGGGGNLGGGGSDAGTGGAVASGGSGGNPLVDAGSSDAPLNPDSACAQQKEQATFEKRPIDVVFVIDNSYSMGGEIDAVEKNINKHFSSIVQTAGVDYRVIVVSEHGESTFGSYRVCIEGALNPSADCKAEQPKLNPPLFFHYDAEMGSHNPVCNLLQWFDQPEPDVPSGAAPLAPNGWQQWLRKEALKSFVVLTDDGVNCSYGNLTFDDLDTAAGAQNAAAAFDQALLARSPDQFGTAEKRNYVWHSIVGLKGKGAGQAWQPGEPIDTAMCESADGAGTGYQAISNLTGGLRFPVCEGVGFDVVFQAVADSVVQGSVLPCEYKVPEPPSPGVTIALDTVLIEYTPGSSGTPSVFNQVATQSACAPGSFYIQNDTIFLCPDACKTVSADNQASIQILYGCEGPGPS